MFKNKRIVIYLVLAVLVGYLSPVALPVLAGK
jgi:hypothetical protein